MTTGNTKQALRAKARQHRDDEAGNGTVAADKMSTFAPDVQSLTPNPAPVISSYLAIGSELDPGPLSDKLRAAGATIALPVMTAKATPLEFRAWAPGDTLVAREWGIREPGTECNVVEPDILLVPLLLVGKTGHRLGYGGGFYDRTLSQLRARKRIVAVGIAYPTQKVDAVAQEAYDEPLDYLLTPFGLEKFHS